MKYLILSISFLLCGCASIPQNCPRFNNCMKLRQIPSYFLIHSSFPEDKRHLVISAAQYWNNLLRYQVFKFTGITNKKISRDGINIIYSTYYGKEKLLGKTTKYVTIAQQSDILEYDITISLNNIIDDLTMEAVLRHEFGHALGMSHSSDPDSLMYFEFLGTNVNLTPQDIKNLYQIY